MNFLVNFYFGINLLPLLMTTPKADPGLFNLIAGTVLKAVIPTSSVAALSAPTVPVPAVPVPVAPSIPAAPPIPVAPSVPVVPGVPENNIPAVPVPAAAIPVVPNVPLDPTAGASSVISGFPIPAGAGNPISSALSLLDVGAALSLTKVVNPCLVPNLIIESILPVLIAVINTLLGMPQLVPLPNIINFSEIIAKLSGISVYGSFLVALVVLIKIILSLILVFVGVLI